MAQNNVEQLLLKSKFRSKFCLDEKDIIYLNSKGLNHLRHHAEQFVIQRLANVQPKNDGKQTPFRGHPVFKAQHATATCCRGCIYKWYRIQRNTELSIQQINFITDIIMRWIEKQYLSFNVQRFYTQNGEDQNGLF